MRRPRASWLALLLVPLAGWATRSVRLVAFTEHQAAQTYEQRYYLPNPSWLPLVSLGYRQALADLIWCRALVYFGEELVHAQDAHYVFDYADAILALDADFRAVYRWVSVVSLYRPGEVKSEDGLRAATYLQRAVARWPRDGELHWDYGALLRFELAPLEHDAVKKRALLERAAPHLETAARLGAGPPWLVLNSSALLSQLGKTEQAIRHLEEVRETARDPAIQAELDARIAHLRQQVQHAAERTAADQFRAARQASYPYMAPGLFLFVGDKPDPHAYARFVMGADDLAEEPQALD